MKHTKEVLLKASIVITLTAIAMLIAITMAATNKGVMSVNPNRHKVVLKDTVSLVLPDSIKVITVKTFYVTEHFKDTVQWLKSDTTAPVITVDTVRTKRK
jgi:3'-phosphoadenosine 5'-phosphosulfate sulfotransferase (PAPS reductase)/FAD synthetase